jgi:tubulin polyglutamylase TTLL11
MFDKTGKSWLLEINDNPSLDIFHSTDYMGGGGPKNISKVDLEVKSLALSSAIKIAKMSESKRTSFEEGYSYIKIFYQTAAVVNFNKLRELFYSVCLIKNRTYITSG